MNVYRSVASVSGERCTRLTYEHEQKSSSSIHPSVYLTPCWENLHISWIRNVCHKNTLILSLRYNTSILNAIYLFIYLWMSLEPTHTHTYCLKLTHFMKEHPQVNSRVTNVWPSSLERHKEPSGENSIQSWKKREMLSAVRMQSHWKIKWMNPAGWMFVCGTMVTRCPTLCMDFVYLLSLANEGAVSHWPAPALC